MGGYAETRRIGGAPRHLPIKPPEPINAGTFEDAWRSTTKGGKKSRWKKSAPLVHYPSVPFDVD